MCLSFPAWACHSGRPEMENLMLNDFLSLPQLDNYSSFPTQQGASGFCLLKSRREEKDFSCILALHISATGGCLKSTCYGLSSCSCRCFGALEVTLEKHSNTFSLQDDVGFFWQDLYSSIPALGIGIAHPFIGFVVSLDSQSGRI